MTYLEWRSILKCERTVTCWEATRCKVKREKVKVESKKWKDNNRAADDRLSRKSRKRKKKKNKERDFRSGYSPRRMGPRGGRREGRGCAARKGPPGQVPSALPPFPFSPSLPPEGGSPPLLKFSFVQKHKVHKHDAKRAGHSSFECWRIDPLSIDSIDEFQDFEFSLFNRRLKFELCVDSSRLFHSKRMS